MLLALAIGSAACFLGGATSTASAGTINVWGCTAPNETVAPIDGWSSFIGAAGIDARNDCGTREGFKINIARGAYAAHVYGHWKFTAPANTRLRQLYLHCAHGAGQWTSYTVFSGREPIYDGNHIREGCSVAQGCGGIGWAAPTFQMGDSDGALILSEGCHGEFGCYDAGPANTTVVRSIATLVDDDAPTYRDRGGTLMANGSRTGTASLTAQLSDAGVGLYRVRATVDGRSFADEKVSDHGGRCRPAAAETDFLHVQPCALTGAANVALNTAELRDGDHVVKVWVTDAAANETLVFNDTVTTANKPVNTAPPRITALPTGIRPAVTVTAEPGSWSRNPTGYDYQWLRCPPTGDLTACEEIAGATGASYVAAAADAYARLAVRVSARNPGGESDPAVSAISTVVPDQDGITDPRPHNTAAPAWTARSNTNTPTVGETIEATPGEWRAPGRVQLTFRFKRCHAAACDIAAAGEKPTYTLTSADVGAQMLAEVTATNSHDQAAATTTRTSFVVARRDDSGGRGGDGEERPPGPREQPGGGGGPAPGPGPVPSPRAGGRAPAARFSIVGLVNPVAGPGHAPNGVSASENARGRIAFDVRRGKKRARVSTVRSTMNRREVIRGQLLNSSGRPIVGAKLVTAWQQAGQARWVAKTGVTTIKDGRFSYILPKGPSRGVKFIYFAHSDSTSYAESNTVRQRVATPVALRVVPRLARNGRTVKFAGQLARIGLPRGGVLVTLEARYPGSKWKQFKVVRSARSGAFTATYRFTSTSTRTRYSFRARVAKQGSYPFDGGLSPTNPVTINP